MKLTKHYQALFGIYAITVPANDEIEAKQRIIEKFNSYKDGSDKKEYIRPKLHMAQEVFPVVFKNGFWREV